MRRKRICRGLLLVDFVMVLLFSTLLSLATGLLDQGDLVLKDVSAVSAVTMQETEPPTSTPAPTPTRSLTPTIVPIPTPTPRFTLTVQPTKAPYVFPKPFYTRERPPSTRSP